jgi:hypothetical protein
MRTHPLAALLALTVSLSSLPGPVLAAAKKKKSEASEPAPSPALTAAPAAPAVVPAPAITASKERREGKVVQVTPGHVYLDAGASEGLAPGQKLQLRRGAGNAGSCVIDKVGDHRASCTGSNARPGDSFALTPPAAAQTKAPLPRPLAQAEINRERQVLSTSVTMPVEHHASEEAQARPLRATVNLTHKSYLSSEYRPWHDERVDAQLGVPLGGFGYFDLDAAAVHLTRPDGDRFRSGSNDQLYVYRAELSLRQGSGGVSGSLGRLLPAAAPGAPRIDGAQVSFKFARAEMGLFGGGIPDAQTLAPGFDRQTAGLFVSLGRAGDRDGAVSYSQATARIAYVKAPEWGTRFEAEAAGLLQLYRRLDLTGSLRLATGDHAPTAAIDAARAGFDLRPSDAVLLTGSFRYVGSQLPVDATGAVLEGKSTHAELAGSFKLGPKATLGIEGGLAQDLTLSTNRGWAGPTLSFPSFFGQGGGLTFGYHEELGDQPGRSVYGMATLNPGKAVQLITRLTVFCDSRSNFAFDDLEAGLYVRLAARLTDHISAHVAAMGRLQPLASQVVPSPLPYGAWVDAGISGDL